MRPEAVVCIWMHPKNASQMPLGYCPIKLIKEILLVLIIFEEKGKNKKKKISLVTNVVSLSAFFYCKKKEIKHFNEMRILYELVQCINYNLQYLRKLKFFFLRAFSSLECKGNIKVFNCFTYTTIRCFFSAVCMRRCKISSH